jgi:hypothetical protein
VSRGAQLQDALFVISPKGMCWLIVNCKKKRGGAMFVISPKGMCWPIVNCKKKKW